MSADSSGGAGASGAASSATACTGAGGEPDAMTSAWRVFKSAMMYAPMVVIADAAAQIGSGAQTVLDAMEETPEQKVLAKKLISYGIGLSGIEHFWGKELGQPLLVRDFLGGSDLPVAAVTATEADSDSGAAVASVVDAAPVESHGATGPEVDLLDLSGSVHPDTDAIHDLRPPDDVGASDGKPASAAGETDPFGLSLLTGDSVAPGSASAAATGPAGIDLLGMGSLDRGAAAGAGAASAADHKSQSASKTPTKSGHLEYMTLPGRVGDAVEILHPCCLSHVTSEDLFLQFWSEKKVKKGMTLFGSRSERESLGRFYVSKSPIKQSFKTDDEISAAGTMESVMLQTGDGVMKVVYIYQENERTMPECEKVKVINTLMGTERTFSIPLGNELSTAAPERDSTFVLSDR